MVHLQNIETLMKKDTRKAFNKTELRDLLRTDYKVILDVLAYLLKENKIIKVKKIGEVEKYKWRV